MLKTCGTRLCFSSSQKLGQSLCPVCFDKHSIGDTLPCEKKTENLAKPKDKARIVGRDAMFTGGLGAVHQAPDGAIGMSIGAAGLQATARGEHSISLRFS